MRSFLPISLCLGLYLSTFGAELSAQRKKPKTPVYNYLSKTKTTEEIQALTNKTEKVYHMICGEFSNQAQADTTKIPYLKTPQQIVAVPIWQDERKGEFWLYYGWFRVGEPKTPLAHGIFKLTSEKDKSDNVRYRLDSYFLPEEPSNYAEEWKKEKPFAGLKPRDLIQGEGCVSYLVESEDTKNLFVCSHDQSNPCKFTISEQIKYYAFIGNFSPDKQVMFTEYFDTDKKLLFGYPRPNGLYLVRQNKNKPMYAQPNKK